MDWSRYTDENGLPEVMGSDGGVIIADEEHGYGSRITLEQPGVCGPFAITCGIYDWMVHTRYCASLETAQRDYELMKTQLATILELIPNRTDPEVDAKMARVCDLISEFVDRFP